MLFLAILALLSALTLSSTAAYFSIFGLMALFAASSGPVAIMGAGLEISKLVAAAWIHNNWRNPKVSRFIKSYMIMAILTLMLITDIGVFGFLSAGHLQIVAPVEGMQIKMESYNQQIDSDQKTIDSANKQLKQLDDSIDTYFKNDRATQGLAARKQQEAERKDLAKTISNAQKDIDRLNKEIQDLKQQVSDTDQKIGPIKYVAQLFWGDNYQAHIDSAVRIMILVIMSVFDPMAVILVIASGISISDYWDERKGRKVLKTETQKTTVASAPQPKIEVKKEEKFIEKTTKSYYNKFRHWGYTKPTDKPKK